MSDLMLHGVLNMPPELWMDNELDKMQRYGRYIQASKRIEDDEKRIAELEKAAEAAFDHCNTSYGTEEFYRTRAELQNALRAGYLKEGP